MLARAVEAATEAGTPEYARQHFARLEAPALHILERLREKIEKREYDSVLGDDADGRLQALLISHAIQKIYGEQKRLRTVFVQGGSILHRTEPLHKEFLVDDKHPLPAFAREKLKTGEVTIREKLNDTEDEEETDGEEYEVYDWKESTTHRDEVKAYLERMKPLLGSKTLLITEEILSGSSIDVLVECLHAIDVNVDVASFGIAESSGVKDDISLTPKGFPILLGSYRFGSMSDLGYKGVMSRGRTGRGHAYPAYTDNSNIPTQDRVRVARQVIKELADSVAKQFLAKRS